MGRGCCRSGVGSGACRSRGFAAVLNYSVTFKTNADDDHRYWPIGPMPSREYALGAFHSAYAIKEGLGAFTFEETSPFLPDYHLIEQAPPYGERVMYPLYKAS
jgi:hypothetical protein